MTLVRAFLICLIVFSGGAIWSTLSATPAFNSALLAETVGGAGQIPARRQMYDKGEYDFQRGYGFLNAIVLVPTGTESIVEIARRQAQLSKDALEDAVQADPANAHAWTALAWARARLNDLPGSAAALDVSWRLAPNSLHLAKSRFNLAGVLSNPERHGLELSEKQVAAVAKDAEIVALFEIRSLWVLSDLQPHMRDRFQLPTKK